ncbi:MAG: flavin reductase, partial [Eggerthellaceae bacterium]|nr:flavin reductase [Eggerthellaceae bacterium]
LALHLSAAHRTVDNIRRTGAFTVSLAGADHVVEADYFGLTSQADTPDKFEKSGLSAKRSEHVDAPMLTDLPLCMECEFVEFDGGKSGPGVIGNIVNVSADDSIIVDDRVDMEAAEAITFDPFTFGYYKVSERVGNAFSEGMEIG